MNIEPITAPTPDDQEHVFEHPRSRDRELLRKLSVKSYVVQFTLPVDNPGNNVRLRVKKKVGIFEVPINHPAAHNIGLQDLIAAVLQG